MALTLFVVFQPQKVTPSDIGAHDLNLHKNDRRLLMFDKMLNMLFETLKACYSLRRFGVKNICGCGVLCSS
jgi:hypothetical protein